MPRNCVSALPVAINRNCHALACFFSAPLIVQQMCRQEKHTANSAVRLITGEHDFSTDLDRRIVVTALEGTQYQALAKKIKQEQRDILE